MQQKHLNFFADFLLDLGGAVLYSIGIGLFAQNAGFAPGGISGLALLFYHLWKLPVGLVTFLMNIPLVILSYRYVGRRFLLRSLRSVILCTILLDVVFVHIPAYSGNQLLAALFSGVFVGAGMAIFYARLVLRWRGPADDDDQGDKAVPFHWVCHDGDRFCYHLPGLAGLWQH